jgi:hypothetical protein
MRPGPKSIPRKPAGFVVLIRDKDDAVAPDAQASVRPASLIRSAH